MKFNDSIKRLGLSVLGLVMLTGMGLVGSANAQNYPYQDRDRYDNRNYGRYNDYRSGWTRDRVRNFAFMFGYRVAYDDAESLRDRRYNDNRYDRYDNDRYGRNYDWRSEQNYRNDVNGWFNWMGYKDDYREQYRKGYEAGFRDGQSSRSRRFSRDAIERVLGARMKDVYPRDVYRDDDYSRDRDDRGGYYGDTGRYSRDEINRIAYQNAYNDAYRHGQNDARSGRQYNYQDSDGYRDGLAGYRSEYGDREFYRQAYREGYHRAYDEGFRSVRRY